VTLSFFKSKPAETEEQRRERVRTEYMEACIEMDALAEKALLQIEEYFWNTYRCRVRIGFELEGTPARNEGFAPSEELIEDINNRYIQTTSVMDGDVLTLVERNVIDCEVSGFEYNFLEYTIKTGANLPQRAIASVPKARAIMQQIAKDYGFGQFHFSEYDPVYHPRATSHPMRTSVSLWRAHLSADTAHPTWANITGHDIIRNHATSGNSLRVLEAGMLFLAPRVTSYNRFDARNPAAPLYFYVKNRDIVMGETGRGVLAFAGEREMTFRIENRLPCQDTRPAVAAVVVLLSVSAGLDGAITFTQEKGDMPIGKDELDAYDAARPIPKHRKEAMSSGKPGSGNACFNEMKRVIGKDLTNDFYKGFSSFLQKMDAHDELMRTEFEEKKTKDVAGPERLDVLAAVKHLRQLAVHGYAKREEAKPQVSVGAPETQMPDAVAAKLDASLERFRPYLDDYFQIFTRLREDIFELNEMERKESFLLRDIGNKRAGQLVACFDRTWDYLYEEEQLVAAAGRQFRMDDMSRIQRIVQYVCNLITQQTMGDLIREADWLLLWGGATQCLPKADVQAQAMAEMTEYLLDTMCKSDGATRSMVAAFDAASRLYRALVEYEGMVQAIDNPLEGMAKFIAMVRGEAEHFAGINIADEAALTAEYGNEVSFLGVMMPTKMFVQTIVPHLLLLGFVKK